MDASEIKPTDAFLRLKVNDLKEICLAGGLARSGRKADLQQRILTAAKHAGRVQQALERLLPNSMPFAHAAPPTPHHHGGASGSAIGRPLMPTGAVGCVGTGELRCPCGSSCWQGGGVMAGLAARCWSTAALWCAGTCTASARSRSPAPEVKGRLESAGVGLWGGRAAAPP